jgi:hypothetical protein
MEKVHQFLQRLVEAAIFTVTINITTTRHLLRPRPAASGSVKL